MFVYKKRNKIKNTQKQKSLNKNLVVNFMNNW